MENRIDYIIYQFLLDLGIPENIASQFQFLFEVLLLVFLCFIADRLAKKLFVRLIHSIVKKTKFLWDDVLLENKVFDRLAHLAPALVIQSTATYVFAVKRSRVTCAFTKTYTPRLYQASRNS